MNLYRYSTCRAYTLIEFLLVCTLIIIILCITIPSWQFLLQNNAASAAVNKITTALEYTRILAIKQNKNISFCRIGFHASKSSEDWSSGQVIVVLGPPAPATVLHTVAAVPKNDHLLWHSSFKKNDCIEFTPLGIPNGQQGSFYYYHGKQTKQIMEIVVQETGNIYKKSV